MAFQIHLKVKNAQGEEVWEAMRPSGDSQPYQWTHREIAERMIRICCPGMNETEVKVVEV